MPTALAYTYCTSAEVEALLSSDGLTGRVDDDASGTRSATESGYISSAISWATSRVNFYCLQQYAAIDLSDSWLVNNWCVICAAYWLSCRRGNPSPGSFDQLYKEAIEDLKLVKSGTYQIPDVALRSAAWPAWSNVRVDALYSLRKIRVERPISDKSPPQGYTQSRDIGADYLVEPN